MPLVLKKSRKAQYQQNSHPHRKFISASDYLSFHELETIFNQFLDDEDNDESIPENTDFSEKSFDIVGDDILNGEITNVTNSYRVLEETGKLRTISEVLDGRGKRSSHVYTPYGETKRNKRRKVENVKTTELAGIRNGTTLKQFGFTDESKKDDKVTLTDEYEYVCFQYFFQVPKEYLLPMLGYSSPMA